MAEANLDAATAELARLTLGSTKGKSFVENAMERVTEKFGSEDWKDPTKMVSYRWDSPSSREKSGDFAEEATLKILGSKEFCELLSEPVYLISGT